MRSWTITVAVAIAVASIVRGVAAQRPDPVGPDARGGFNVVERLMGHDKDKDGKVTKDELPEQMRERLLKRFDANQDGMIDRAEAEKIVEGFGRGGPGMTGRGGASDKGFVDRIMSFDKNKDGKVAADEIPKTMRMIINRVDANGDGVIERSELKKMRQGTRLWNPPAAEEDVGEKTATHIEIEPLPIEFGELKALRLRKDGNLLAADAEEGLLKVVSQSGELLNQIDPGFHPQVFDIDPEGGIYCGGDGFVAKLTADGKLLKKVKLPEPAKSDVPARRASRRPPGFSGLAVADDAVYVTFGSGWSVSSKAKLYRYTLDLENPQLIAEGLRVCCQHCDIAFRDGLLYLSENSAYRILIYDRAGDVVKKWGSKSRNDLALFGGCCNPMNITFGTDGTLYTAESGLGRVKRYSPDGEFLGLVGYLDVERFIRGSALSAACCHIPFAITPDGDRVYITDVKTNTIRVLQREPR